MLIYKLQQGKMHLVVLCTHVAGSFIVFNEVYYILRLPIVRNTLSSWHESFGAISTRFINLLDPLSRACCAILKYLHLNEVMEKAGQYALQAFKYVLHALGYVLVKAVRFVVPIVVFCSKVAVRLLLKIFFIILLLAFLATKIPGFRSAVGFVGKRLPVLRAFYPKFELEQAGKQEGSAESAN